MARVLLCYRCVLANYHISYQKEPYDLSYSHASSTDAVVHSSGARPNGQFFRWITRRSSRQSHGESNAIEAGSPTVASYGQSASARNV